MKTFIKEYSKSGDKLITDNYMLADGTYILVSEDGEIKCENILEINKKNYDQINSERFVVMDYLSKLLAMNKPIDRTKTIHSNNYYSFWIKKNNIKEKLNAEIIDGYYNNLLYPKKSELYDSVENEIGVPDKDKIDKHKSWIKENIFSIIKNLDIKDDKNYLKIYFQGTVDEYEKESKRYNLPNIYNSADYNIRINDVIYGMPNNNIGLNSKKPFLLNKSRKVSTPYLVSQDEVLMQKKLFDFLINFTNDGKTNIYVDEEKFTPVGNTELLDEDFSGYFLKLKRGMEVEIHDFDNISFYTPNLNGFKLKQVIPVDSIAHDLKKENLIYADVLKLERLQEYINVLFFNKFLIGNYFTEVKDIRLNNSIMKEELIRSRIAYFNWFYKGNKNSIKSLFERSSLKIIKDTISNGYYFKALEQFNLREAVLEYFGGDRKMAERLDDIYKGLREKANDKEMSLIVNDDEYYFAIGQVAYFLLSKNKSATKKQSLINPLINCSNNENLMQKINGLYKKYNYDIDFSYLRFNNLYNMILIYDPKNKKVNDDVLLAGFLCKNIIYEKSEKVGGK